MSVRQKIGLLIFILACAYVPVFYFLNDKGLGLGILIWVQTLSGLAFLYPTNE